MAGKRRRLEPWQQGDTAWGVRLWSSWGWRYVAPFAALFLLVWTPQTLGPAWRAHLFDSGTQGVVTVTEKHCHKGGCSYDGDFVSDDGTIRRGGVNLASGFDRPEVGMTMEAHDTGGPSVYPHGGGYDWIITGLLFVGGLVVLYLWCRTVPPRWRRRRQAAARTDPGAPDVAS